MSESSQAANRLAGESSPYLLLHQHNPVDWYPWGEEALARARREDKPIFLSVGYSTCYWCHVMERESFSDESVAELMNRELVSIKVDREERPDLDEIYMVATQILTGHGGWPNSVFLTPDLEPFFAGTYFPPEERHGQPSFRRLVVSLAEAWKNRRDEIEEQAKSLGGALSHYLERRAAPAPSPPDASVVGRSVRALERLYDAQWGGFGGAPKFPTPANLYLLAEVAPEDQRAAEMLTGSLDRMARGGLFDQLGGGFHRYATDAEWKIPHFEKMLYDNGLLLELYALEWARTEEPEAARVARETVGYLEREMLAPEGFFWSALDAETGAEEGAYYVWSRDEMREVLGEEDFEFAAPLLGFDGAPFFEGSKYVLHLPRPLSVQVAQRQMSRDELLAGLDPLRARLLEARDERPRPATDDKVLADWNGMVIGGLATAGRLLPEPAFVERAVGAAEAVLEHLRRSDGVLLHSWREGRDGAAAFLSDYAFLVHGLLALHRATSDERWLTAATDLTDEQIDRLADPLGGFFNAAERDDLLVRPKEIVDGALPAANAVACLDLLALAERTGDDSWRRHAEATLRAFASQVEQRPEGARMMAVAVARAGGAQLSGAAEAPESPEPPESPESPGGTPMQAEAARAVEAHLGLGASDADGWRSFELDLKIAEGLHLNAHPASLDFLVPTEVSGSRARRGGLPRWGGARGVVRRAADRGLPWRGTHRGAAARRRQAPSRLPGVQRAGLPSGGADRPAGRLTGLSRDTVSGGHRGSGLNPMSGLYLGATRRPFHAVVQAS